MFVEHTNKKSSHLGAGAHHQIAVAECAIKTVTGLACTMSMHHMTKWPNAMDPGLWPFALDQAIFMWNHMPHPTFHLAPIVLFAST